MANAAHEVKYRQLKVGEVVEAGDEYQSEETKIWKRVPTTAVGTVIDLAHLPHRRLCLCGAQQPQHCDLTELVADLRERMARLEHHFAAAKRKATPPQPDPASPAEGLCTDDLAKVTAERDAALRVARVILEVTWRPEKNLEPPAKWRWQDFVNLSGDPLEPGESVRVVEEPEAMKCMTKLRRERDAARAECKRLRESAGRLTDERDAFARLFRDANDAANLQYDKDLERARFDAHEARVACVRLTLDRDAARAECERLKEQIVALEGQSRMESEAEIAVEEAWERCGITPHWPDDEAGSSQRYAASMETEIGRLRDRVAELEAASAVPSWPLGWLTAEERDSVDHAADIIEDMEDDDGNSLKKKADALRAILARPSSEPRGWLTAELRGALADAATTLHELSHFRLSWALHSLLARETPPRVKVPPRPVFHDSDYGDGQNKAWKECAATYIAAIREAGVEVEE